MAGATKAEKAMQAVVEVAIQRNMDNVNTKLNDILTSIDGVKSAISAATTRIADLEQRFDAFEDSIAPTVVSEVQKATTGITQDINTLNMTVDNVRAQVDAIKLDSTCKNIDERSIVIKRLEIKDADKLEEEVTKLIRVVLKIHVPIESVCFLREIEGRITPIKVTFRSVDDKIAVLRVKSELEETDIYEDVRIEVYRDKMEIINRSNWITILNKLGKEGKGLRVAGSGKIVRKTRNTEKDGDDVKGNGGAIVSADDGSEASPGTQGGPVPGSVGKPKKKKRRRKQRSAAANGGTNGAPKSTEVAAETNSLHKSPGGSETENGNSSTLTSPAHAAQGKGGPASAMGSNVVTRQRAARASASMPAEDTVLTTATVLNPELEAEAPDMNSVSNGTTLKPRTK